MFGFLMGEALRDLRRAGRVAVSAILLVTLSLAALGGFWLVSANLDRAVGRWRDRVRIIVYLRREPAETDLPALLERVHGVPGVGRDPRRRARADHAARRAPRGRGGRGRRGLGRAALAVAAPADDDRPRDRRRARPRRDPERDDRHDARPARPAARDRDHAAGRRARAHDPAAAPAPTAGPT